MKQGKVDQSQKVRAIKRPNKKKPIQKEQKVEQKKQSKNGRGRPVKKNVKNQVQMNISQSQSFSIDSEYNSIDLIKNNFIDYMTNIGYPKGLVFTQQARKKLINEQDNGSVLYKIQWDTSHQWFKSEEIEKLKDHVEQIIKENLVKEQCREDLINVFLDVGDIFAREVTAEIYKILQNLIRLSPKIESRNKSKEIQQILGEYIEHVCSNQEYYFITGKFSKAFLPSKEIRNPLAILFKEITKKFRQVIKNGRITRE